MSQLLGRMVFLAVLLLFVGTAADQGQGQGAISDEDGTYTLAEEELNEIIQRAYQLGYKKGYSEGAKKRQIIQVVLPPVENPDIDNQIVPQGVRGLLPSLPGVSTGQ